MKNFYVALCFSYYLNEKITYGSKGVPVHTLKKMDNILVHLLKNTKAQTLCYPGDQSFMARFEIWKLENNFNNATDDPMPFFLDVIEKECNGLIVMTIPDSLKIKSTPKTPNRITLGAWRETEKALQLGLPVLHYKEETGTLIEIPDMEFFTTYFHKLELEETFNTIHAMCNKELSLDK